MSEFFKFITDMVGQVGIFGTILLMSFVVAPYGFGIALYNMLVQANKNNAAMWETYSTKMSSLTEVQKETVGYIKEMSEGMKGMIMELSGKLTGALDVLKFFIVKDNPAAANKEGDNNV